MVIFITFGQTHTHSHNGFTLDKDCVGAIHCNSHSHGRDLAFEWFGSKFAGTHTKIDNDFMDWFPKGTFDLN